MTAPDRLARVHSLAAAVAEGRAYYNEIDPFAAQWLRNLIERGLIANGDVDERSIIDVRAADLVGYSQCHFFAGIGGWPHALRLAGWPDEACIWTGSCPCQPLSVAGQRKDHADERHLWPAFYGLIAECAPPIVFGEQVASHDGREWLAGVRADLESVGYACGAADLCAAGVGAPQRRQRLYWVADTPKLYRDGGNNYPGSSCQSTLSISEPGNCGRDDCMAYAERQQEYKKQQRPSENEGKRCSDGVGGCGMDIGPWGRYDTIAGRRIKPGVRLLADGIPSRMGRLRAYGNAIVPQVAAQFVGAWIAAMVERERNRTPDLFEGTA